MFHVVGSVFFYIGGRMHMLLTGVHFLQCSEYWVICISVCVINAYVIFADFFICSIFLMCLCALCILVGSLGI
jgi:hypothetical protein